MTKPSSCTPWLAAVVAAALVAITAGLGFAVRALDRAARSEPAARAATAPPESREVAALPAARHARKPPAAFGLPTFPGATDFHSMEARGEIGSVAFRAPGASPERIARYYIEALGASGWQFSWQRDASERPSPSAPAFRGTRVRWLSPNGRRELYLLAVADPRSGAPAQAVLSWSPAPPVETRAPAP